MTSKQLKEFQKLVYLLSLLLVAGCGSTSKITSTPIENIDLIPLKVTKLTEDQKRG